MYRTASDTSPGLVRGAPAPAAAAEWSDAWLMRLAALGLGLAATAFAASGLAGQEAPQDPAVEATSGDVEAIDDVAQQAARRLVAYSTDMDGDDAELSLEFAGGREVAFELREGRVYVDGRRIGTYDPGAALDRSWRDLLRDLDGPPGAVAQRIIDWEPVGEGVEQALDDALEDFLSGAAGPEAYGARDAIEFPGGAGDSVVRLNVRIQELERVVEELESNRERMRMEIRDATRTTGFGQRAVRRIGRGIAGIFATLVTYGVLLGIGWAIVYFGGRPYLEAIADTARRQPVRSWAVGFAGAFLLLPAFIIGILVLVVSIVGIPALIVWLPGFPIAVMLAALLGFIGVAHAGGEFMAERRFHGGEWFQRANSFYYLLTGVGLLLALPLAAHAVGMAPFLGFFEGLLQFVGAMAIWIAATIGFGAVLLTRAGTRQPDGSKTQPARAEPDAPAVEEELGV